MDSLWRYFEYAFHGLAVLLGQGIGLLGNKVAESAVPAGRPIDKIHNARRMKKEMAELRKLSARLSKYSDQAEETCRDLSRRVVFGVLNPNTDEPLSQVVEAAQKLCLDTLCYEQYFPLFVFNKRQRMSISELWDLLEAARAQLEFYENPQRRVAVENFLRVLLENLLPQIPPIGQGEEPLGVVDLLSLHTNHGLLIDGLIGTMVSNKGFFPKLRRTLVKNSCVISGKNPVRVEQGYEEPSRARDHKNVSPAALMVNYLDNTPFIEFFSATPPFAIPFDSRFEHMHLVGGSGHGKTQTLQNLILPDLFEVGEGRRSVIVIDSQGDMIENILKLAIVGEISDRVVLIYPQDLKHPAALNLFDFGLDRLESYSDLEQEKLINGAIALYEYVFGALLGAELTQRQGVIFRYLARLLMIVPGANIHTLMGFMEEPESVRPYISKLDDPITRRFFETQFFAKDFNDTRHQILTRLYGVLSIRSLARMFESQRNKLNLFDSMNRGSLILIHTSKDLLKQEGCEILGRFFIALIAQATQERASIRDERRTPTFVYIDEAHDYFDKSIENLLVQARKYNVGLVIAHQFLGQFDRRLFEAVNPNTAIKMVGGLSYEDARDFANEMGCEREFLQSMQKGDGYTQFACMVKNCTSRPLRVSIPLGIMEGMSKVDPRVFKEFILRNRERYCRDITEEQDPLDNRGFTPDDDSPLGDPELL